MNKPSSDLHLRLSHSLDEKLQKIATDQKTSKSEAARRMIIAGMNSTGYSKDEDYIYTVVKQAVEEAFDRPIERLAAINARNAQTSATEFFLLAWLAKELLKSNPQSAALVEQAVNDARELGIRFLKVPKDKNADKYIKNGVNKI